MPVKILIPTPLRSYTGKNKSVVVDGKTIKDLLYNLSKEYPALAKHLFADTGNLRSFINVYVNDQDIRALKDTDTPVIESDTVSIIPAIAGGRA